MVAQVVGIDHHKLFEIEDRDLHSLLVPPERRCRVEPLDDLEAKILPSRSFCEFAVGFLALETARARRSLRFSTTYYCMLSCRDVTEDCLTNAVCRYASLKAE